MAGVDTSVPAMIGYIIQRSDKWQELMTVVPAVIGYIIQRSDKWQELTTVVPAIIGYTSDMMTKSRIFSLRLAVK